MKPSFIRRLLPSALALVFLLSPIPSAFGQGQPFGFEIGLSWPAQAAGTGTLGGFSAIGLQYFSIDWVVSGTVSACSVTLDGAQSLNSFSTGSIISSQSCATTGTFATSSASENLQARVSYSITGTGTVTFLVRGFAVSGSTVASSVAVTNFPTSQNVVCTSGCNGSNGSVSATGSGVPTLATYLGANNGSGVLTGLSADSSGHLNVNVISGGGSNSSVGSNGSTAPTSSTAIGAANGGNLVQLAADSSDYLDTDLAKVGGSSVALGQTTMSASLPVAIASNQSNLPENLAQVNGSTVSTAASGVQLIGMEGHAGAAVDAAAGATAAANSLLGGGVYNSSAPAPSSGQQEPFQLDSAGRLIVDCGSGCGGSGGTSLADEATFTQGTTSLTPIGGIYSTSITNLTSGQAGAVQLTNTRHLMVNVADALPAGGNTIGAVTQASGPWTINQTQLGGTALGAPSNYGTSPGAVEVQGVNAFVTNTVGENVAQVNGSTVSTAASGVQLIGIEGHAGAAVDAAAGATAAANSLLGGGVYNSSAPAPSSGQQEPFQLDSAGRLIVDCGSGCGGSGGTSLADEATFTQGTSSLTPIGGIYSTSITNLTSGQAGALQLTADRNAYVNVNRIGGTAISLFATLFNAQAATATATSSAVRVPGMQNSGTLQITGTSITGSPSGCQVALESETSLGTPASSAFSTVSFTPGNSYQSFAVTPSAANAAADMMVAVYSCGTYPTAGTISVAFAAATGVNILNPLGQTTMSASLPVAIASNQSNLPENLAQVNGSTVSTAASGVQLIGMEGHAGAAVDAAAGATAAANSLLGGGVYNSSAPAPSSGQQEPLQLDSSGNLKVNVENTPTVDIAASQTIAVTQPTAANLNATVVPGSGATFDVTGTGTAGSPASNPVTVQGISSMTPLAVSDNTTANSPTNPLSDQISDGTNGPVAVKPGIGTNTIPPAFSTAGATNANPSLTTTVSPNSGVPAIIQWTTGTGSGSQTSLATSNFSTNPTAGNSIVAIVGVGNGTPPGVTDTIGNSFTEAGCYANSSTFETCFYYATNIKGGATDAVTVTPSASTSLNIAAAEVSGIIGVGGGGSTSTASSTVNQQNSVDVLLGSSGSSTSPLSGYRINGYANELAFGAIAIGTANQTPSAFSPWTKNFDLATGGTPSGLFGLHVFSQPLGSMNGTISLAATITSEPWAAAVVSFKSAPMVNASVSGYVAQVPDARSYEYSASSYFAGSSTTDNAVLPGNLSNTVLVTRVVVTCTETTAGSFHLSLIKRSAADTGGTSASMTVVPEDSNYPVGVSAPLTYTGTGPTAGAAVGDVDDAQIGCNATSTAGPNDIYILNLSQHPIVLRGTAQQLAVNANGAITGGELTVQFKWIETIAPTP